jgi:hypothetical protein
MRDAIKALEKSILELALETSNIEPNDILALCKHYKNIYEAEAEIEKLYKIIEGMKQTMSYETLPTVFENNKVDYVSLVGRQFIVGGRINASIPSEMRPTGHAWLESVGSGAIIIPTVNPKTLSGFVKSYIEDTGKQPPEDAVKVHFQRYTTMRKK